MIFMLGFSVMELELPLTGFWILVLEFTKPKQTLPVNKELFTLYASLQEKVHLLLTGILNKSIWIIKVKLEKQIGNVCG